MPSPAYYAAHRQDVLAQQKARYTTDLEYRARRLAKAKADYRQDPAKFIGRVRASLNPARVKARRDTRRAMFYESLCVDCGATTSANGKSLERDHLPGTVKLFNVGANLLMRDVAKLQAEADKCDLVCRECHVKRTVARRQQAAA